MHHTTHPFKSMITTLLGIRPSIATIASSVTIAAPVSVWTQYIHGVAGLIVIILSVPTAFFILLYWAIKARSEWIELKRNLTNRKPK